MHPHRTRPDVRILHIDKFIAGPLYEAGGVGTYLRALTGRQRQRGHQTQQFGTTVEPDRQDLPRFFDFAARWMSFTSIPPGRRC